MRKNHIVHFKCPNCDSVYLVQLYKDWKEFTCMVCGYKKLFDSYKEKLSEIDRRDKEWRSIVIRGLNHE